MRKTLSAEQKDQIFRLRKMREDLGLSQEEFANTLEISISTYKKMESYERRISLASLMKLHSALNVSADYILFGEKTEKQEAWTDVLNCSDNDKMIIFLRLFQYFTLNKTDLLSVWDDRMDSIEEMVCIIEAACNAEKWMADEKNSKT
ncbi:MAG: helix-turn-helix domain-containing protein [Clostridiales bacterium]|nr:helix-turn-helix domain-containing protein [Clostridiales bacterium]